MNIYLFISLIPVSFGTKTKKYFKASLFISIVLAYVSHQVTKKKKKEMEKEKANVNELQLVYSEQGELL